ncbi:MAG: hypothetical protein OER85_07045 [Gammaproteobacteria bacterium]|nr:hypothetical protein [Gammaproteobacteria bacterium]
MQFAKIPVFAPYARKFLSQLHGIADSAVHDRVDELIFHLGNKVDALPARPYSSIVMLAK